MMRLLQKYNHIFLWIVIAIPLVMQFFPRANKFDLVEQFLPVMVVAFLVTIGCVKGWFFSAQRKEPAFKGPDMWAVIVVTLFTIWSTLAFFFGEVRTFGFTEIYMLWTGVLMFMYFSTCSEDKVSLLKKYLPVGLSLLLIINALGGVYGFLTTDHTRFFGLFYNPEIKADAWPNAYALFFILTFPFLIYRLFHKHFEKYKDHLEGTHTGMMLLKLVLTGFVYGTFLMVFSRAGYIAFIGELALLILFSVIHLWPVSRKHIMHWIVGSLIVAIVGWGTASGLQHWKSLNWETTDVSERLSFNDSQGATSFNERFEFFEGSIELAQNKPFFGYGPSSFKWVYPQVQQGFLSLSDHPHNWPLKLSVERGAPAAALMLVFFLVLFVRTNPFSKNTSMFAKMAWAGFTAALAHELVDHNFNFITNYFIFWLIAIALIAEYPAKSPKSQLSDKFSALVSLVLVIALATSSLAIVRQTTRYKAMMNTNTYERGYAQNAQALLPRWWFFRLEHITDSHELLNESAALMKKQISYNPYDAMAYGRLAEIMFDLDRIEDSHNFYAKAIEVNPKNTFKYYDGYVLTALRLNNQEAIENIRPTVEKLIEEYMPLYEANLHFTQRDEEILHVDELRRMLGL